MARVSLPPGFRFHPTDVELVMYYLKRKIMGKKLRFEAIAELNIYKFFPWDLKDKSCLRNRDLEVFFFCPREKKYASGQRTNRSAPGGYWKTTGKDRTVVYNERSVGMVKTLVFHLGQAPQGERTDWVMHEYRFMDKDLAVTGVVQDAYVLCKVFKKSGRGPQNGAQYGAPFNEDDYNEEGICCADSASALDAVMAPHLVSQPNNPNGSSSLTMIGPGNMNDGCFSEGPSSPAGPSLTEVSPINEVDMDSLLALFTVDDTPSLPAEFDNTEVLGAINPKDITGINSSDGNDIFNGLGDLGGYSVNSNNGGFNTEEGGGYNTQISMLVGDDDTAFLELNDLNTPLRFASAEDSGFTAAAHLQSVSSSSFAPYGSCDVFGQIPSEDNFCNAAENGSALYHQLPPLPESLGNHFAVLKENGIGSGANQEEFTTLHDMYYSPRRVEGSNRSSSSSQAQIRGEEQRTPVINGGSSINIIKAEVTPRADGCTKDALLLFWGEFSSNTTLKKTDASWPSSFNLRLRKILIFSVGLIYVSGIPFILEMTTSAYFLIALIIITYNQWICTSDLIVSNALTFIRIEVLSTIFQLGSCCSFVFGLNFLFGFQLDLIVLVCCFLCLDLIRFLFWLVVFFNSVLFRRGEIYMNCQNYG